jgi:hypothetical protein
VRTRRAAPASIGTVANPSSSTANGASPAAQPNGAMA